MKLYILGRRKQTMKKNSQTLRDLCDIIKYANICTVGVPEEEEKRAIRIFEEMMVKNFPHLTNDMNLHIQEAQGALGKINSKRSTLRHINNQAVETQRKSSKKEKRSDCHIYGSSIK